MAEIKRQVGRPPVNATPITVRLPPSLLSELDSWIAEQPDNSKPSRPEAIRLALHDWLVGLGTSKRGDHGG